MKCAVEMGFRCHEIHTKFHKDWFRHSRLMWGRGRYRDTQTGRRSHNSLIKQRVLCISRKGSPLHLKP
jgi:hypothetical protein